MSECYPACACVYSYATRGGDVHAPDCLVKLEFDRLRTDLASKGKEIEELQKQLEGYYTAWFGIGRALAHHGTVDLQDEWAAFNEERRAKAGRRG